MTNANYGRVVTALGVIALSPDGLLVRLIAADVWTVVWWRTVLTTVGIAVFLILRHRSAAIGLVRDSLGRSGLAVSVLFGAGTVLFVLAIANTSVANVLVILAAGPLFGAFLSRVLLHESVRGETWAAAAIVIAGLAALFADSYDTGRLLGDACALGASLCTSGSFVVLRRHRGPSPMVLVAGGSLLAAVAVTALAHPTAIDARDAMFLALLGFVVLPVAFSLIFLGPRFISAPEVGLLMLLETALGPIWVWLAIGEVPTRTAAFAGLLVVATLAAHSAIALGRDRRR